jgi:predicted amino acid racemase
MKRLILALLVLCVAVPCWAISVTNSIDQKRLWLNGYGWTGNEQKDRLFLWAQEIEDVADANTAWEFVYYNPTTQPASVEGYLYYNNAAKNFQFYNGSSWAAFDTGSAISLDAAYDVGSKIDADSGVVEIEVDDASNNAGLLIDQDDVTNDSDAIQVALAGAGDGLQITVEETDGVASRFIAAASQTTSLSVFDAATSNWDGADNIGMVHVTADDPLISTGASLVQIVNSGQPIAAAEGFALRIVDTGTARTDAYAMEIETTNTTPALMLNNQFTISGADQAGVLFDITGIDTTGNTDTMTIDHSGTGDALQITCTEADSVALRALTAASQTTSAVVVDGATGNFIGADNVGMVSLTTDTAGANAGATALYVAHATAQPISAAEGFLARFVSTGTARTNAWAVEIETTNTQPALFMNNQLTITGADSAGILMAITGNDTSGNTDTATFNGAGTGDVVQITCDDADSVALHCIGAASQTTTVANFDGSTNNWIGADNVGLLTVANDTAGANTGATLVSVTNSAQPIAAAEGFMARFVDTGTARTDAYAVEIETTNTTPCLMLNNQMTITGADSGGILLDITGNDAAGNSDTVTINAEGTGDALQITCDDADSVALRCLSAASQTTSLAVLDGSTGNWIGANDVGMLQLTTDTAGANAGTAMLLLTSSAQPVSAAEGFLARFVDTGTARTNAYAVEIETTNTTPCLNLNNELVISGADGSGTLLTVTHVGATGDADGIVVASSGAGDAIQVTCTDADSVAIRAITAASQTTSAVVIDGSTGNWIGANDVGMLQMTTDTAGANAGTAMLLLTSSAQPVASAEGFMARFVDTGTARTDAYAVEIETTNTTPALMLNNQMTITGADSAGILLDITGNDTTGNSDTVTINGDGTGDALQITADGTTSVGLNVVGATSQTTSLVKFDGATGTWLGAASLGMVHITNDGTPAATSATLLRVNQSGTNISGQEGVCAAFLDTSTSGGGTEYAVHIDSTNNEGLYVDAGRVVIDESLTATLGYQCGIGETLTANSDNGAGSTVDDNVRVVNVTAVNAAATDWILLPNDPPMGTEVVVLANAGSNFEIRTLTAGNDTINGIDTSDGAVEYLATDTDVITFVYHLADGWIGHSLMADGDRRAKVVPD